MKICLNSRQIHQYLKLADEIKIHYEDRDIITAYSDKYPDKTLILEIYSSSEVNWDEIQQYNIIAQKKLILCVTTAAQAQKCQELGIRWYLGYGVSNYFDLNTLAQLQPAYILLEGELFFDLPRIKNYGIPIRAIPNIAHQGQLPRKEGVCGTWIRPDDLEEYEKYIDAIEFEDCDIKKEQALYRIYCERKTWPGELTEIITNLNYPGTNRLIPPGRLAQRRISCGLLCQKRPACQYCYRVLDLAQPNIIREYKLAQDSN